MKINIQKVLRFCLPVLCCVVLLFGMTISVSAVGTIFWDQYISSVVTNNGQATLNLKYDYTQTYSYIEYNDQVLLDGIAYEYNYSTPATSTSSLTYTVRPQFKISNSATSNLPCEIIESGNTLYVKMKIGADVPINSSYTNFLVRFYYRDGTVAVVDYGTYTREKVSGVYYYVGNYTFDDVPDAFYSWDCFFSYSRSGLEQQGVINADIRISDAYITMPTDQYNDLRDSSNDTIEGTPEMNEDADNMESDAADKNDDMNDALDGATPEKPNVDDVPMDYDSIVNDEAGTTINNTFKIITDNGIITPMLLAVVIIMVIGYVLYGKKK